jgi:hypothetical protein
LKIRGILRGLKFVSLYVERSKKISKKWLFALGYLRILLRSSVAGAKSKEGLCAKKGW